jgi:hypothetical protein
MRSFHWLGILVGAILLLNLIDSNILCICRGAGAAKGYRAVGRSKRWLRSLFLSRLG